MTKKIKKSAEHRSGITCVEKEGGIRPMGSGGEPKWAPFKAEPISFNHKIRWLLANDKNPLMVTCADKLGVKDYVEDKLGPGLTPKTLARATSVEALASEIKNSSSHPDVFSLVRPRSRRSK